MFGSRRDFRHVDGANRDSLTVSSIDLSGCKLIEGVNSLRTVGYALLLNMFEIMYGIEWLKKNNQMERLQHFNVTLRVRAIFMRLFGSATFTATLKLVSLVGLR